MNRNQNATASTTQSEDYFDLHVKGCGYLSRVREVPAGRKNDSFLACAVSALHGLCTDPSYSYFDMRVTGADAAELVRKLAGDVDKGRKVFIAFRAGDVYADPYETMEKDLDTRQPTGKKVLRASIKGRLLQITHAKVDGEVVFSSPKDEATDSDTSPAGDSDQRNVGSDEDTGRSPTDDSQTRWQERQGQSEAQPSPTPAARRTDSRDRTRVRSYAETAAA